MQFLMGFAALNPSYGLLMTAEKISDTMLAGA